MSDVRQCRKVLFLEARNFGDAIIKNTLIFQYGVGKSKLISGQSGSLQIYFQETHEFIKSTIPDFPSLE